MNTSVAGFNTGLASQKASAAPLDTDWRRMPAATGAAQQVHIMPGSAISAPSTVPEKRRWPSVRASQSRGISTCTSEPNSTPEQRRLPYRGEVDQRVLPGRQPGARGAVGQDRFADRVAVRRHERLAVVRLPFDVVEADGHHQQKQDRFPQRPGAWGGFRGIQRLRHGSGQSQSTVAPA